MQIKTFPYPPVEERSSIYNNQERCTGAVKAANMKRIKPCFNDPKDFKPAKN